MNSIEIAIKMETDAVAFYRKAAAQAQNRVNQKVFLSIAEDEKRHLDTLKEIMQGLDIHLTDVSPVAQGKTIFEEHKEEITDRSAGSEDELHALAIAMDMEKEGKTFYRKAASEAKTAKEMSLFEWLVREEEEHFAIFSATYFFLRGSGNASVREGQRIVDTDSSFDLDRRSIE